MANKNTALASASKAKKDEFYTQLSDIDNELRHYRQHFKNKTILCNCDDPFESNFFKHFAMHFNDYELKKLIGVCYHSSPIAGGQLSLFDNLENYEPVHGVVLEIEELTDLNGDGAINLADVEIYLQTQKDKVRTLKGDGDFRSEESIKLLEEADIVCTNPPFSKFREFIQLLVQKNKKFLIIGSQNAITYKEFFPLLMNNEVWLGYGFKGNVGFFESPYEDTAMSNQHKEGMIRVSGVMWFTNLETTKRHEPYETWAKYSPKNYLKYDNYEAIEVSKTTEIPRDYKGIMGVPITYMDKYCPEQFEIVGITKTWFGAASKTYGKQTQVDKNGKRSIVSKLNDGPSIKVETIPQGKTYYEVDGNTYIQAYARILIRYTDQWIIDHPEDFE